MKYLLTVVLVAGISFEMRAQEEKSERTASAVYTHRQLSGDTDPYVAPIRISEPLYLIKYDTVTEEVTKTEFEDLAKHVNKNVEYIKALRGSEALEPYGYKGRNGVIILALKGKPTFSDEFLNRKRNSSTN